MVWGLVCIILYFWQSKNTSKSSLLCLLLLVLMDIRELKVLCHIINKVDLTLGIFLKKTIIITNPLRVMDQFSILEHRRGKHLQHGRATLFEDYAFLPVKLPWKGLTGATFAIEIKPKQAWLPLNQRGSDRCTYCMNQYLKVRVTCLFIYIYWLLYWQLKKGQIQKISNYCPLDLFSG